MSWASKRKATRIEDIAYCLMGIFNVSIPLLCGKGERAFIRLQEEIMRSKYNHSRFAWNHCFPNTLFGTGFALEKGPLVGVGVFAPHPVAFGNSANITPHAMKTEPYAMTNRVLQIHLRILEHDLPEFTHTHFAILQCGYRNILGSAIATPLAQMSASGMSESKDDFCRAADQGFVKVNYPHAASLGNQKVYLLAAEPLFNVPYPFHRCWFREYGHEVRVRFHKARYCQYPIEIQDRDDASHRWNYENRSMTWQKTWRGAKPALYFSKNDGPAFVVVLTFVRLLDGGGHAGMDVHIELVRVCMNVPMCKVLDQVVLRQIRVEHTPFEHGRGMGEAKTTFPFESLIMTARVKNEVVFDGDMVVLDLFFSGVNRRISEVTPES